MKRNNNTEFEIVEKIKKGDTSAFRFLVEKYKDVSFSLACSILRNENDAEDALQESFIKAFKAIKKFRYKSSFSTWLYKIVVNTSNTYLKRQKKKQNFTDKDSWDNLELYSNDTGLDQLISSEQTVIVNKILDSMKSEESLLLRLYYLSELDVREIMEITKFKESKIKVSLFRARKNALKQFQKIFGSEFTLI